MQPNVKPTVVMDPGRKVQPVEAHDESQDADKGVAGGTSSDSHKSDDKDKGTGRPSEATEDICEEWSMF